MGGVPASYLDYLAMLRDVFDECRRVLEPGGRIAVNVANLGRRPYRSLASDVVRILQDDLGLLLRGEIVWVKAEGASGSCAWGSYRSPANPVLRDVSERVIVASKGRFDRARPAARRRAEGLPCGGHRHRRRVPRVHPRRLAHPPRERPPGRPSGPLPRRAPPTADRAVHVPGRPRPRPLPRLGVDGGGGRPHRPPVGGLRHRPRLRGRGPGHGWRPRRLELVTLRRRQDAGRPSPFGIGRVAVDVLAAAGFAEVGTGPAIRGTGLTVDLTALDAGRHPVVLRRLRRLHHPPGRPGPHRRGVGGVGPGVGGRGRRPAPVRAPHQPPARPPTRPPPGSSRGWARRASSTPSSSSPTTAGTASGPTPPAAATSRPEPGFWSARHLG